MTIQFTKAKNLLRTLKKQMQKNKQEQIFNQIYKMLLKNSKKKITQTSQKGNKKLKNFQFKLNQKNIMKL